MDTPTAPNLPSNSEVLVTGAAGFIASRTAQLLLDQGVRVVGIDNLNDYYDPRLKHFRLEKLKEHSNFSFVRGDIERMDQVEALFASSRFSVVFNLAARAGVRYSMENPFVYLATNAMGTLNLLEQMRAKGVKKLVLASTSSLYAGEKMPFHEELPVNTPISPYAASKKAAEAMAHSYHHLYGMDVSVVRYFTVYGPAGRPDMCIFRFIKWVDEGKPIQLSGDGSQSRDFTYVDDIAEGTILAGKPIGFEVMNLGGGKESVTLLEIISQIERLLGKKAKIENHAFHKADVKETRADIRKAERLLGWKPRVGILEGLGRSVEWYLENKSWLKDVKV
jgi:nucleoside-diphosphate-sugar epimerase